MGFRCLPTDTAFFCHFLLWLPLLCTGTALPFTLPLFSYIFMTLVWCCVRVIYVAAPCLSCCCYHQTFFYVLALYFPHYVCYSTGISPVHYYCPQDLGCTCWLPLPFALDNLFWRCYGRVTYAIRICFAWVLVSIHYYATYVPHACHTVLHTASIAASTVLLTTWPVRLRTYDALRWFAGVGRITDGTALAEHCCALRILHVLPSYCLTTCLLLFPDVHGTNI